MPLTKFDALAALIAAATGLAMAEDRSRTEIMSPAARTVVEAMTPEICAAEAEYRRRALRVTVILTGGMPDADWRGQPKAAAGACADVPAAAPVQVAPAPLYRRYTPEFSP